MLRSPLWMLLAGFHSTLTRAPGLSDFGKTRRTSFFVASQRKRSRRIDGGATIARPSRWLRAITRPQLWETFKTNPADQTGRDHARQDLWGGLHRTRKDPLTGAALLPDYTGRLSMYASARSVDAAVASGWSLSFGKSPGTLLFVSLPVSALGQVAAAIRHSPSNYGYLFFDERHYDLDFGSSPTAAAKAIEQMLDRLSPVGGQSDIEILRITQADQRAVVAAGPRFEAHLCRQIPTGHWLLAP